MIEVIQVPVISLYLVQFLALHRGYRGVLARVDLPSLSQLARSL
jgi:hypothetical protein